MNTAGALSGSFAGLLADANKLCMMGVMHACRACRNITDNRTCTLPYCKCMHRRARPCSSPDCQTAHTARHQKHQDCSKAQACWDSRRDLCVELLLQLLPLLLHSHPGLLALVVAGDLIRQMVLVGIDQGMCGIKPAGCITAQHSMP